MPLTLEKKVDLLWDKLAISELMNAFGRALDLHDWELYERCMCDSFEVDFERLTGFAPVMTTAAQWAKFAAAALDPLVVHHQYSNHSIKVKGDEATGITYMVARHLAPGEQAWNTQYGWYENTYQRTDSDFGWKISRLRHDYQWTSGTPQIIDLDNEAAQEAMRGVFGEQV